MQLIAPGSVLSYPAFRRLWASSLLVTIGAAAFPIALAVTVLDAGGNATSLGVILASRVLSSVLLALVGGVWADRLPRKYVMIGADVYRGFLMLGLVFVGTQTLLLGHLQFSFLRWVRVKLLVFQLWCDFAQRFACRQTSRWKCFAQYQFQNRTNCWTGRWRTIRCGDRRSYDFCDYCCFFLRRYCATFQN